MYHLPIIREISQNNYKYELLPDSTNVTFIKTYMFFPLITESFYSLFYNSAIFKLLPLFLFFLLSLLLYKLLKEFLSDFLESKYRLIHNIVPIFVLTLPILLMQSNRFYVDLFLTLNSLVAFYTLFRIYKEGFSFSNSLIFGISVMAMNLIKMSGLTFTIPLFFMLMALFNLKNIKYYVLIGSFYFLSSLHYIRNLILFGSVSDINVEPLGFFEYTIQFFSGFLDNLGYPEYLIFIFIFLSIFFIIKLWNNKKNMLFYSSLYYILSIIAFILIAIFSKQKLIMIHSFYFRYMLPVSVILFSISFIYFFDLKKWLSRIPIILIIIFFVISSFSIYLDVNINIYPIQDEVINNLGYYPLSFISETINEDLSYSIDSYKGRVFSFTDRITYLLDDPFRSISYSKEGMIENLDKICSNNGYLILFEYDDFGGDRGYRESENHIILPGIEDFNVDLYSFNNNYHKYTFIVCGEN